MRVRTDIPRVHGGDVCNLDERGHRSAARPGQWLVRIWKGDLTYKTPMLMAMHTPIFSAFFICNDHRSFQGRKARTRSIAAEYAKILSQQGKMRPYESKHLPAEKVL